MANSSTLDEHKINLLHDGGPSSLLHTGTPASPTEAQYNLHLLHLSPASTPTSTPIDIHSNNNNMLSIDMPLLRPLTDLHDDELFAICQFLGKRDLMQLGQTCKMSYRVSQRSALWRPFVEQEKSHISYLIRNAKRDTGIVIPDPTLLLPNTSNNTPLLSYNDNTATSTSMSSLPSGADVDFRRLYLEYKKKAKYAKRVKQVIDSRSRNTFYARYKMRDCICPIVFFFFLVVTSLAILATCVLAPLWFDGTIPNNNEQPWWYGTCTF